MARISTFILLFLSFTMSAQWQSGGPAIGAANILTVVSKGSKIYAHTLWDIYVSDNNGASWTELPFLGSSHNSMAVMGNYLLITQTDDIFISADDGMSWSGFYTGHSATIGHVLVKGSSIFAFPITLISEIHRSTDNGYNWQVSFQGLPNPNYSTLRFVATTGNDIFFGTYEGEIFKSSNNGDSWTQLTSNIWATSIAGQGNNVYMTQFDQYVYSSTDGGLTWSPMSNTGLNGSNLVSVAMFGNMLFAGTNNSGVYAYSQSSQSWMPINDGLPANFNANKLAVSDNYLFAMPQLGFNQSVWQRPFLDITDVPDVENQLSVTVAPYTVKGQFYIGGLKTSEAMLTIYNMQGQLVYKKRMKENNIIDLSEQAPGIYIYKCEFDCGRQIIDKILLYY